MTRRDAFLFGSLGGAVALVWCGVLAVRYELPGWWVLVDGLLAGFILAGPVYAEIWRRAWRHTAREVINEAHRESRKLFDEAHAAQLLVQGIELKRGEFKPGDPCHRCGYVWPAECECIDWNTEARERHKRERESR